jgi:hypothetical protein
MEDEMSTSGFYGFDPSFNALLRESKTICKEVDKSLADRQGGDIVDLLALEYRLTEISDRVTAYLSPAEV